MRTRNSGATACACWPNSATPWMPSRTFPRSKARGSPMAKWVYGFGAGRNEGSAEMRNLLGGKGANLAEMASIGLPVPPGFTITTEVCTWYYEHGKKYPEDLRAQVAEALSRVEEAVGSRFRNPRRPLLVSVRSGARVSM